MSQSRKHNRSHRDSEILARHTHTRADGEEGGGKVFAKVRKEMAIVPHGCA